MLPATGGVGRQKAIIQHKGAQVEMGSRAILWAGDIYYGSGTAQLVECLDG